MAVTLNLGGNNASMNTLEDIFQKENVDHDIYFLGTQEACHSIGKSMIMPSKEKLDKMVL